MDWKLTIETLKKLWLVSIVLVIAISNRCTLVLFYLLSRTMVFLRLRFEQDSAVIGVPGSILFQN